MRVVVARSEVASDDLLEEIDVAQCFFFVIAGIIWVLIMSWSQYRSAGACGKAQQGKLDARTTKELIPTLERSMWAIMDDDEVHSVTDGEACQRKYYRKLNVVNCFQRGEPGPGRRV